MIMKNKNLYISPDTDMVLIQTQQFIAISGKVDGGTTPGLSEDPTPGDASSGKSRRKDIWTDPEEEEEDLQ